MSSRSKADNQKKYTFDNKHLVEVIDNDGKPCYVDLEKLKKAIAQHSEQSVPSDPKIPRFSQAGKECETNTFPDVFHHNGSTYCVDGFHSNQNNQCRDGKFSDFNPYSDLELNS